MVSLFHPRFRLLPEVVKADENLDEYFGQTFCGGLQHKLWNLLENPNSSFAAKVSEINFHEKYFNVNFAFSLSDFCNHVLFVCCSLDVLAHHLDPAHVSGEIDSP